MTNSIFKCFALSTAMLSPSWAFAEILASQPAECKISTPGFLQPTLRDLTQMTCRYECAERVRSEFGATVSVIPAGVACLWDGADKTREFLVDQNVLVATAAAEHAAAPESTATPQNHPIPRTSLVSPYTYTNKSQRKSAKTLAKKERRALKDGTLSESEAQKIGELRELAHTYDVARRTDAMETAIEGFEGRPAYPALVEHLKSVQQLEQVLARDGEMSASEATILSGRLLHLEADVAIASGGGIDEKRAVVLEAFKEAQKNQASLEG